MEFLGRVEEIQTLNRQLELVIENGRSRMVVVTGRRRVGKTRLIYEALENAGGPFIYNYVTKGASERSFASQIVNNIATQLGIQYHLAVDSLSSALNYLMDIAKQRPIIFVIDECQEIDSFDPFFWSTLQHIWDREKERTKLLLVMSGSIQSSIERIFGSKSEPLFGRCDVLMTLRPFSTIMMKEIFERDLSSKDPMDFLLFYALTGGVASHVELFADAKARTADEMLGLVYSHSGSWFRSEGFLMLANEFRVLSPIYFEILQKISYGLTKRSEIQNNISQDVSVYIKRLEELFGLVSRVYPILRERQVRQTRYRIADPYFRFWLQFIATPHMQQLDESGKWDLMKKEVRGSLPTFLGHTLEQWFIRYTLETGQWQQVGSWWDKRGQNEIDLIAINKMEQKLLIGEVKLNPKKIDMALLKRKADVFLSEHNLKKYDVEIKGFSIKDMLS